MKHPRPLGRGAALLLSLAALVRPTSATWSIVAVDTRTGEVAVASATCVPGIDLLALTPVVRVGVGAAAAQAGGDADGSQRAIVLAGFEAGLGAQEILDLLAQQNGFEGRQFGIVTLGSDPVTHTGTGNGAAAKGAVGRVGDVLYAIQGNVLAGDAVVDRCEETLRGAAGDLSQRVLAAMETARAYGGDGRCSCAPARPTSCGSPPPSFTKSAHVGYLVVARLGDTDGNCTAGGCATGEYWLKLNVIGSGGAPDPVLRLRSLYDGFRVRHANRPDALTSSARLAAPSLPADGRTGTSLLVSLRDIDGAPLTQGGATVTAEVHPDDLGLAEVESVANHGDGTYTVRVRAGSRTGSARFLVRAEQQGVRALLVPYPTLEVEPVTPLFCGFDEIDPLRTQTVPLILNVPGAARAGYVILGSASGTTPGVPFAGSALPLNPDVLFGLTRAFAGGPYLPGTVGRLDADGHAEAGFVTPAPWTAALGTRVDWAAVVLGAPPLATNADGFDVVQAVRRAGPGGAQAFR